MSEIKLVIPTFAMIFKEVYDIEFSERVKVIKIKICFTNP